MIKPTPVIYFSPVLVCGGGNGIEVFMGWIAICHSNLKERKCPVKSDDEGDDWTIGRFQTDATGSKNFIHIMKKRTNETEYNYCKRENQVAM